MLIRRRDFLTGAAAISTHAALAQSIAPQIGGGIGQAFDGGLGGAGNALPALALTFSGAELTFNSQIITF